MTYSCVASPVNGTAFIWRFASLNKHSKCFYTVQHHSHTHWYTLRPRLPYRDTFTHIHTLEAPHQIQRLQHWTARDRTTDLPVGKRLLYHLSHSRLYARRPTSPFYGWSCVGNSSRRVPERVGDISAVSSISVFHGLEQKNFPVSFVSDVEFLSSPWTSRRSQAELWTDRKWACSWPPPHSRVFIIHWACGWTGVELSHCDNFLKLKDALVLSNLTEAICPRKRCVQHWNTWSSVCCSLKCLHLNMNDSLIWKGHLSTFQNIQ